MWIQSLHESSIIHANVVQNWTLSAHC